jgi:arabinose-5-phosphate isomerase
MPLDRLSLVAKGKECIAIEADALHATGEALGEPFAEVALAVSATLANGRKLIFTGVGKSAHIAQKLTGTFNSVGAPACFLDPTQALHGDLGLCSEGDLCILLSNSGETQEIVRLVPILKRFGLRSVALTSQAESTLARSSDFQLVYRVPREACPLKLAPTASTTAALALGDALAMVLLEHRGLTRDDFARFHPSGALGMYLLLRVADIMRRGERFPCLPESCTTQEAILAMTKAKSGSIALVDPATGKLAGILTDGDFRRSALSGPDFLQQPVSRFMTRSPITVRDDALATEALRIFERSKIDDLIVLNADQIPVGLVDGQDLPRLRIV